MGQIINPQQLETVKFEQNWPVRPRMRCFRLRTVVHVSDLIYVIRVIWSSMIRMRRHWRRTQTAESGSASCYSAWLLASMISLLLEYLATDTARPMSPRCLTGRCSAISRPYFAFAVRLFVTPCLPRPALFCPAMSTVLNIWKLKGS